MVHLPCISTIRGTSLNFRARPLCNHVDANCRTFLEYVRTNKAPKGFASEVAAAVDRVKADGKEKEIYMSLAMDIQMYVEKEREEWLAKGEAKGRAKGRAEGRAEWLAEWLANPMCQDSCKSRGTEI